MLSFGTVGDLFGRKKVMLAGVAVFCAGSVIAAVAPNTDILIAGGSSWASVPPPPSPGRCR